MTIRTAVSTAFILAACVLSTRSPLRAQDADPKVVKAFMDECALKVSATADKKTMTAVGKDGWLFLPSELRHVSVGTFWGEDAAKVARTSRPDFADPLPAILDFKTQLDELGIALVVVPVPPKAIIYPEMISDTVSISDGAPPPRLDIHHQAFYELLRARGVAVVDLVPGMLARRFDKDGAMYCKQDTHWSGQACILTAKMLSEKIKNEPWYKEVPKVKFSYENVTIEIAGDLWQTLKDETIPQEKLPVRLVGVKGDTGLIPITPDRNSPVLLMGDSHGLVFHEGGDMLASGAGLADQLALELGFPVDLMAKRGSGATPARIDLYKKGTSDPTYLQRKKLIIWCFSSREFTEVSDGWRKVPVSKKSK